MTGSRCSSAATGWQRRGTGRLRRPSSGATRYSANTVRSHMDRIRDKTGCRRRADLTRLALQAGLA